MNYSVVLVRKSSPGTKLKKKYIKEFQRGGKETEFLQCMAQKCDFITGKTILCQSFTGRHFFHIKTHFLLIISQEQTRFFFLKNQTGHGIKLSTLPMRYWKSLL